MKHKGVDAETLFCFFLTHGWEYTRMPPELSKHARRTLQRTLQRKLSPEALSVADVAHALLAVDPPSYPRRKTKKVPKGDVKPF